MFSNYLSSIEEVAKYPEFSLILFFVIFTIVVIRTLRMDKKLVDEMSNIPFNSNESEIKDEN
ncbi:MAG: cbb3-type cytochrome c oxidase subunit 3 [Ignavibacteria bacterium]|nr:MAG: cbb3-type cytochrome c oxidase subunit 3 [Ignavibacteria bacterium]